MNTKESSATLFHSYADVITVPELAKMLRIGRNTAYNLVKRGQVPFVKVGNQIRIPKARVIEFINRT